MVEIRVVKTPKGFRVDRITWINKHKGIFSKRILKYFHYDNAKRCAERFADKMRIKEGLRL